MSLLRAAPTGGGVLLALPPGVRRLAAWSAEGAGRHGLTWQVSGPLGGWVYLPLGGGRTIVNLHGASVGWYQLEACAQGRLHGPEPALVVAVLRRSLPRPGRPDPAVLAGDLGVDPAAVLYLLGHEQEPAPGALGLTWRALHPTEPAEALRAWLDRAFEHAGRALPSADRWRAAVLAAAGWRGPLEALCSPDPVEVLHLGPAWRTDAEAELRRTWRRAARACHPDLDGRPDAVLRFQAVADAWEIVQAERALIPRADLRSPGLRALLGLPAGVWEVLPQVSVGRVSRQGWALRR